MFLKSLEIRGFKSFADRTVLEFTPGVAVIVGPNGSGKSNLVDAIAWVLGEQGPKTLRGGKMEDVIFAGTPKRPGAGRAEVTLTIDNSAGILPIEFTEVSITRTLFKGGESEYAINGVQCRLIDVQELLSDSGIGRELHTIVGQGQLDDVLNARAEERRAYVEEAAGILKHRRRKERAIRKLERTDADIERLGDVISELRRQIRPLEQQAELAKRAAEIEADMRAVKVRVWAHDYRALVSEGDREAEARLTDEATSLAAEIVSIGERVEGLEASIASATNDAQEAMASEFRLAAAGERFAGLAALAEERRRHLDDLAARAPEGEAPSDEEIESCANELATVSAERVTAEQEARAAEEEWLRSVQAKEAAARAREEVVHLHGERAALRAAVEAATQERNRLEDLRNVLARAREERAAEIGEIASVLRRLDELETDLDKELDMAQTRYDQSSAQADELAGDVIELERALAATQTRRAVLEAEAARALPPELRDKTKFPGLVGRARDLVRAERGWERAVLAALEPYGDAMLAASSSDAVSGVEHLKRSGGRGAFVVGNEAASLPAGVRPIGDVIAEAPRELLALLAGVGIAPSFAEAVSLVRANPTLVIVTPDGDRVSAAVVTGGSAEAIGTDLQETLASVTAQLAEEERALQTMRERATAARREADARRLDVEALAARANELDAEIAGAADRMSALEREDHAADREDGVLAGRITEVTERLGHDSQRLSQVESRLGRVVADEPPAQDPTVLAAMERRAAERSLRLGTLTERERAAAARLADLRARAAAVAEAKAQWERSRFSWAAAAKRAGEIALASAAARERIEIWCAEAREARAAHDARRTDLDGDLAHLRRRRREAEARFAEVREETHRTELARAERSHRLAALVERIQSDYALQPDAALAEADAAAGNDDSDIEELRRRMNTLERRLGLLGRVNPIAMEQYSGLVDRHAFLTEQVNDLKKSRKDLVSVVEEVDAKIREVFTQAFEDVSREFTSVFGRMFPGGEGRLTLTDADPLIAGVEVEARPGGKRVKRISLLSGGERSLVALALLYAIFRARPSPFYLLDEVEPALDDVNLQRFLELTAEFREASQIIIVTHQKRTMEIAEVLYGISMAADGVTRVISQALEEPTPVA